MPNNQNPLTQYLQYVTVETYVNDTAAAVELIKYIIGNQQAPTAHVEDVTSCYWWEGKVEQEKEVRVSFDLPADRAMKVVKSIELIHPYQLPAIMVRPLVPGTTDTGKWLIDPAYTPAKANATNLL